MAEIKVSLTELQNHIQELAQLDQELLGIDTFVPEIQGSGKTAQVAAEVAQGMKVMQKTLDVLIKNSIGFFENVKKSYEEQDQMLSAAIRSD